jgi:orotate phosphoribosyltransferase
MKNEKIVADKLLQANAIQLKPDQPFTWASGWKSPVYCDNRRVLSFPFLRDYIKSELCNLIFEEYPDTQLIAGVATAGIAWGAMAADQLKLPFIYVRPQPKQHGLGNQIEGFFQPGNRVVIVEDLISTGKSSMAVAEVLRKEGLLIDGLVSIFNYGFPVAVDLFKHAGISVESLTSYSSLIELSIEKGFISPKLEELLLNWSTDPANWNGV